MNISGIGQSYSAYSSSYASSGARGMQKGSFDPSDINASTLIQNADTNQDGVLSNDETGLSTDIFSTLDTDSDGALSNDELEKMLSNMNGMGGMGPPPPKGGMGEKPMSIESIMKKEDTNGDSKISADESALSSDAFSEIDADQDGFLTADEIEKSHKNKEQPADGTGLNSSSGSTLTQGTQTLASSSTSTRDEAIKAYQQAIQAFIMNFSGQSSNSTLSSVLNAIA